MLLGSVRMKRSLQGVTIRAEIALEQLIATGAMLIFDVTVQLRF